MPSQQTMRRNSLAPGAVANPVFAPPLRQRASAPPLGDMAVGTMMLKDPSYLNVRGPRITLTFKGVPASNALQALARLGGYGFVYNSSASPTKTEAEGELPNTSIFSNPPVTASFANEDYRSAVNLILSSTGLQARLIGNTITVGRDALSNSGGTLLSKVYRLNQASPKSAAEYLASLGALIRVPNTTTTVSSESSSEGAAGGAAGSGQSSVSAVFGASGQDAATRRATTSTQIITYGGGGGPLTGLSGTTDGRLGTITLVGSPNLVEVAEQYLKQLDLRQRQVALSIKILDVALGNDKTIDNSFAFRYGNSFIVNQQGQLLANFGSLKPPNSEEAGLPSSYNGVTGSPIVGAGGFRLPGPGGEPFLTPSFFPKSSNSREFTTPGSATPFYNPSYPFRPSFGAYNNPGQPGVTGYTPATEDRTVRDPDTGRSIIIRGTPESYENSSPTAFQYPQNQFFDFVKAVIESRSTKILASPTLILSEDSSGNRLEGGWNQSGGGGGQASQSTSNFLPQIGRAKSNEAAVIVGEQVITNFTVQAGQNGAPNTCQPVLEIAGLTFGARVSKIDDNGFITFTLSPRISGVIRRQIVQGCGATDILSVRSLDTGSARVRDGQTLILTGVLSDRDIEQVTKWPIFGDLPLVGQFFRNTNGNREKRELVVMVTPRIVNDTEGGTFGYGYEPSTREMRQFMTPSLSTPMPSGFPK